MGLYLAIDAGGTKTNCLLANDHRVLARASTGTVKLLRVSEEEATSRLNFMLEEVAGASGTSLDHVTRTCLGLAGLTTPAARAWARQILPAMVAGQFLLLGDEEIALDAAFHGGPGILVIAGTGSNVVGRDTHGVTLSAGGWGPVLGDEGSGFWIGLEAIRAALRAEDRAPAHPPSLGKRPAVPSSCLLREIQLHWQLDTVAELVAFANQRSGLRRPAPDFATLAPVVARCAERGDALAAGVLERAGVELAEQVAVVAHKLSAAHPSDPTLDPADNAQPLTIAFTGSVLTHIPAVLDAMAARLAVSLPQAHLHHTPVDPLDGALWRARRG